MIDVRCECPSVVNVAPFPHEFSNATGDRMTGAGMLFGCVVILHFEKWEEVRGRGTGTGENAVVAMVVEQRNRGETV